jgi:hypothetical protein
VADRVASGRLAALDRRVLPAAVPAADKTMNDRKRKLLAIVIGAGSMTVVAIVDVWAGSCTSRPAAGGGTITSCTGGPTCTTRPAVGDGVITSCR